VSFRVGFFDFDKELEHWLGAFSQADKDQRIAYYNRFKAEMRVMRYLEIHQGKATIQRHPMLEISASFKVSKRHEDLVKIDLETVWGKFIAKDDRAIHAFSPRENGFDMLWAVAPGDRYVISGVMQITAHRG
jgi:hypothetical protein